MLCINALSQVVFFHPFPLKRGGGEGGRVVSALPS